MNTKKYYIKYKGDRMEYVIESDNYTEFSNNLEDLIEANIEIIDIWEGSCEE